MNSFRAVLLSVIVFSCVSISTVTFAQDPLKVCSKIYHPVIDTEGVRMLKIIYKPGDVAVMHQHPFHILYVLSKGELTITNKGDKPQILKLTPGMVLPIPAVTHVVKNTGTTTFEGLIVEVKDKTINASAKKPVGK